MRWNTEEFDEQIVRAEEEPDIEIHVRIGEEMKERLGDVLGQDVSIPEELIEMREDFSEDQDDEINKILDNIGHRIP
jgi:hypothetical protein